MPLPGHISVEINNRGTYGHWEGDLVLFSREYGKANLTSLIERRSRYAVLIRKPSRHSVGVIDGVQRELRALPAHLRRSITFDRGREFSRYPLLKQALGIESFFCQPSAPWQKAASKTATAASAGSCR